MRFISIIFFLFISLNTSAIDIQGDYICVIENIVGIEPHQSLEGYERGETLDFNTNYYNEKKYAGEIPLLHDSQWLFDLDIRKIGEKEQGQDYIWGTKWLEKRDPRVKKILEACDKNNPKWNAGVIGSQKLDVPVFVCNSIPEYILQTWYSPHLYTRAGIENNYISYVSRNDNLSEILFKKLSDNSIDSYLLTFGDLVSPHSLRFVHTVQNKLFHSYYLVEGHCNKKIN